MARINISKKEVTGTKSHALSMERAKRERTPRSLTLIRNGLRTSNDLAAVFVAVMCDVIESRLSTSQGNAVSNVGGKLLKTKDMEFRNGKVDPKTQQKVFLLTA